MVDILTIFLLKYSVGEKIGRIMFYSKETFELRKKTSADILENEQNKADEIETCPSLKNNSDVSYKQKKERFLIDMKENEKPTDINEIKNRQMQTFAETSSEYYTMPAKHSVLIYILLSVFLVLMFASAAVVLYFNFSQYRVVKYDYNDMKPEFSEGTVFLLDKHIEIKKDDSIGSFIYYQNEIGKNVIRKIVDTNNFEEFKIGVSTLEEGAEVQTYNLQANTPIGMVKQTFGDGTGMTIYLLANYGYVLSAVFCVLSLTLLIIRAVSSKKASNKFMNRMDKTRADIEKRRMQLSEGVSQMQSGSADNIEVLSDLLNVSNSIPGEERLEKINKQLQERQLKQVEEIKKDKKQTTESNEQKQENDVINFVRNEIEKQQQKDVLSEDEIEKRRKDAEETNKDI